MGRADPIPALVRVLRPAARRPRPRALDLRLHRAGGWAPCCGPPPPQLPCPSTLALRRWFGSLPPPPLLPLRSPGCCLALACGLALERTMDGPGLARAEVPKPPRLHRGGFTNFSRSCTRPSLDWFIEERV
jgi:hypothetical protein